MPVANATFVAGTNRRLPTPDKSGGFEGPPERILRLSFQVNELPVVLPSLVTRERWEVRREPPPSSISSSNSSSSSSSSSSSMGGGFGSSSSRLPASTVPAGASPAAGAAAADERGVWVPHQALAVAPLLNMVQALVRTGRRYVEPHLGGSSTGAATTIATAADLHRSSSSSTGSSTGSSSSSHSSSWALTSPSSSTSNTPSTPNTPTSGSSTPGSSTLGSSTPGSSSSSAGAAWGALPPPSPRIDAAGVSLAGYAPGYKEVNQDAALLVDAFLSNRQQLLAVFDGHGPEGHRVSGFARRNLPHTLLHQLLEGGGEGQEEAGGAGGKEGKEQGRPAAAAGAGKTAAASGSGNGTGHGNASCSGSGSGSGFNSTGGGGGGGAVQRALWRAVESLDAQLAVSGIDVVNSGTTAAMCHVHGRALTAAWVGDSRIVLGVPAAALAGVVAASGGAAAAAAAAGHKTDNGGVGGGGCGGGLSSSLRGLGISSSSGEVVAAAAAEGGAAPGIKWGHPPTASPPSPSSGGSGGSGWRVVWQSTDHKPELPAEAARIEAAGGRVARSVGPQGPVGPFRVWFKKQDYPGLAMSRALGDLPGRQIGVVATPSTAALTLPPEGRPAVLVLASDGVWELMSNEQVLALAGNAGSAAEAASRVVQQSRRAWVKEYGGSYIDDITAVVVRFNMPPTARAQTPGAGAAGAGAAGAAAPAAGSKL